MLDTYQLFHLCESVKCFTPSNVGHLMSKWLLLLPRWKKEEAAVVLIYLQVSAFNCAWTRVPELVLLRSWGRAEDPAVALLQMCDQKGVVLGSVNALWKGRNKALLHINYI